MGRRVEIVFGILVTSVAWAFSNDSGISARSGSPPAATLTGSGSLSLSGDEASTFKERYRRLIPYMTYYVSNNYVDPQSSVPSHYQGKSSPTVRGMRLKIAKPLINRNKSSATGNNNNNNNNNYYYYGNAQPQHEKFVPSVQYDPRDMDNADYFVPLRHHDDRVATNYEDYRSTNQYQPYLQTTTNFDREPQQIYYVTTPKPAYGDVLVRKPTRRPITSNQNGYNNQNADYNNEQDTASLRYYVRPRPQEPRPFRLPQTHLPRQRNQNFDLNHIVKSLQLSNQLPEELNASNIDSSIRTLVEILSLLQTGKNYETDVYEQQASLPAIYPQDYEGLRISGAIPPLTSQYNAPSQLLPQGIRVPTQNLQTDDDYYDADGVEPPKANARPKPRPVNTTPHGYQITEDLSHDVTPITTTTTELPTTRGYSPPKDAATRLQDFPPTSSKYGATRGKPNVDYPAYSTIPKTTFDCVTQRYKGFFGDPDTGCQVWHYCDLNGGISSFLCPNGTIFSQVALTCDWWFNVKCESTTQLYVLNERLYKYIIPVKPKFPEDFTGPEVDRYLELKFKEMEAKMKEKHLKKQQEKTDDKSNPRTNDKTPNDSK